VGGTLLVTLAGANKTRRLRAAVCAAGPATWCAWPSPSRQCWPRTPVTSRWALC